MRVALHAFPDEAAPAARLGEALGLEPRLVDVHSFPDGETLPTVAGGALTVLLYRSLDRPDAKLMPLLLACDAWWRAGARRLVLVAPYLAYMRQDAVFRPGQPLSRDVLGGLLVRNFDRLVTVDPHLHRTADLGRQWRMPVSVLSAAPALAAALGGGAGTVVIGPDVESAPWARALAAALKAPHATFRKHRAGDWEVSLETGGAPPVRGRRVVLADDVASTGQTLATAARAAKRLGAARVDVAVTHALFGPRGEERLRAAGVDSIVYSDSCAAGARGVALAAVLCAALADELP